jgi:hypothetical protein
LGGGEVKRQYKGCAYRHVHVTVHQGAASKTVAWASAWLASAAVPVLIPLD